MTTFLWRALGGELRGRMMCRDKRRNSQATNAEAAPRPAPLFSVTGRGGEMSAESGGLCRRFLLPSHPR
jgi:hypothetical protein